MKKTTWVFFFYKYGKFWSILGGQKDERKPLFFEVCHIDQGIYKVKLKVALNEKRKKLCGFSFSINIANFEAFCWTKKLISNLFFLKSVYSEAENFLHLRCINYAQFSASTR